MTTGRINQVTILSRPQFNIQRELNATSCYRLVESSFEHSALFRLLLWCNQRTRSPRFLTQLQPESWECRNPQFATSFQNFPWHSNLKSPWRRANNGASSMDTIGVRCISMVGGDLLTERELTHKSLHHIAAYEALMQTLPPR